MTVNCIHCGKPLSHFVVKYPNFPSGEMSLTPSEGASEFEHFGIKNYNILTGIINTEYICPECGEVITIYPAIAVKFLAGRTVEKIMLNKQRGDRL